MMAVSASGTLSSPLPTIMLQHIMPKGGPNVKKIVMRISIVPIATIKMLDSLVLCHSCRRSPVLLMHEAMQVYVKPLPGVG